MPVMPIDAPQHDALEVPVFPGLSRSRGYSLLISGLISCIIFCLYFAALPRVVLPGEAASLLAGVAEVAPNLSPRHLPWRWLLGFTVLVSGKNIMFAANILSAAMGSICAGLLYLVVQTSLELAAAGAGLGTSIKDQDREILRLSTLGGLYSSAALALSTPFRYASLQADVQLFALFTVLLALYMMLYFMAYGTTLSLMCFSFLLGLGVTQSGAIILLTPFICLKLFMWSASSGCIRTRDVIGMVLCFLTGASLLVLQTLLFRFSEGFVLMGYHRYLQLFFTELANLAADASGPFGRIGFLLSAATTVLPLGAIFLIVHNALNEKPGKTVGLAHVVLLAITLTGLCNTPASLWRVLDESNTQPVFVTMTAAVFGYCTAFFYLQLRYCAAAGLSEFDKDADTDPPLLKAKLLIMRTLAPIWLCFSVMLLIPVARFGFSAINKAQTTFALQYADRLLDATTEDKWLVTLGTFDDVIRLRAKMRERQIRIIDIAGTGANTVASRILQQQINDHALRQAAEGGALHLIRSWINTRPAAPDELVLTIFPDFWTAGGYAACSDGVVFYGRPINETSPMPDAGYAESFKEGMASIFTALESASASKSQRVRRLAAHVRTEISRNANDLACQFEKKGHAEVAFSLYDFVSRFDTQNLSSLINAATLAEELPNTPDSVKLSIIERLETVSAEKRAFSALALVTMQGRLRSPTAIMRTGLDWVALGDDEMAMHSFQAALDKGGETTEQAQLLRRIMAETALRQNDLSTACVLYQTMFVVDNMDISAISGLFDVELLRGDIAKAGELLKQLFDLDAPALVTLDKTASLALAAGRLDEAFAASEKLLKLSGGEARAYLLLSEIWVRRHEHAEHDSEKKDALRQAELATEQLASYLHAEDVSVLLSCARVAIIQKRHSAARDFLIRASGLTANNLEILANILRIDFMLQDKVSAYKHAALIIQKNDTHRFANYVLALIAFDNKDFNRAESFLEKSTRTGKFDESERLRELISKARTAAESGTNTTYNAW